MLADRVLAVTDDPDRSFLDVRLRAFQLFLLMHVSARLWLWALRPRDDNAAPQILLALLVTGCFLAGLRRRWARWATVVAATALFVKLVASFPRTSNHAFLEWLAMTLLASLDPRCPHNAALLSQTYRWITVIILFWSGVQKILYGTYFDARYFGVSIANDPRFTGFFQPLLPSQELARLTASDPTQVGTGPFAIRAMLPVILSNLTYAFEIAAAPLLLTRATRAATAILCVAFVALVQVGAREILFGALFVNLLLLFLSSDLNRRLLPVFGLLYLWLISMRLGFVPAMYVN